MATSSITKNFLISGKRQVEIFADAIEASANAHATHTQVNVTYLQNAADIKKFMDKRKKTSSEDK